MPTDDRPFYIDQFGNLCAHGTVILPVSNSLAPGAWALSCDSANDLHALGYKAGKLHEDDGQMISKQAQARIAAAKADLHVPDAEEAELDREAFERGGGKAKR